VKVLFVPHYENLNMDRMVTQARKNPLINPYLPEDRDLHKVPRQWFINVAYTVLGEPFAGWVKSEIENRNEELAIKQKLYIEMDPEIAKAFHASVNISSKSLSSSLSASYLILTLSVDCSDQWSLSSSLESRFETQENAG